MSIANQIPATADKEIVFGMAFPYSLGATGFPAKGTPVKRVFYQIVALILTGKNERVMHPNLGINAHDYVFEDLTAIMMARLSSTVTRAIEQWVPDAKVLGVTPSVEKDDDGTNARVIFDIQYRLANQTASAQIPVSLSTP